MKTKKMKPKKMKPKILYHYFSDNYGYYELTIKETKNSYIVIIITNVSNDYNKEIRFRKTEKMKKDIEYLIKTDDVSWFRFYYTADRDNGSYWQSWKKIF